MPNITLNYLTIKYEFICEIERNKLAKKLKNQINGMENGLEKSNIVTKFVVDQLTFAKFATKIMLTKIMLTKFIVNQICWP